MQGPPCRSVSGGCPVEILATTDREWVLAEAIGCRSTSTVRAFVWQRQQRADEAIDDPLTEVAREGARRMLAQVLIAEAASFIAMWKDLRLPDGRDRIVRRADGRDHARRGSLNRWHQEPSSDKFLVMCRHLECWQPRCQRRLRLTFFSLRWRSMAE